MSELIYTFKKGEGWVPITPPKLPIWLKGHEIRVGDVLDMYKMTPNSPETQFWNKNGVVKRVLETPGSECYSGTECTFYYNLNSTIEWRVISRQVTLE